MSIKGEISFCQILHALHDPMCSIFPQLNAHEKEILKLNERIDLLQKELSLYRAAIIGVEKIMLDKIAG